MDRLVRGPYDLLITAQRRQLIEELPSELVAEIEDLSPADSIEYLVREVSERLRKQLRSVGDEHNSSKILEQANSFLRGLGSSEAESRALVEIRDRVAKRSKEHPIPLSQSAFVTNDQHLNYHALLKSELETADSVDWICPFIGSQGLNLLFEQLQPLGNKLRVLTTTYLGGTHQQALERLVKAGALVKIVYERPEQKTSLHAKAWIFHRATGFSTATIGSSNLSHKALVDGLEWNIRLSSVDSPLVLQELQTTFERLWLDERFDLFDPARDGERLSRALKHQRGDESSGSFHLDVNPYIHQQEALDALRLARLEGRNKNLIVAATGTGKTLIAAFDYAQLSRQNGGPMSLLFVAHRSDILSQSLAAFRAVLRNQGFGELHVGSNRADHWRFVFASVQSLHSKKLAEMSSGHFDVVIIDEFHHAEAPTYRRLLDHFKPKQTLGLTATPERTDGNDDLIHSFGPYTYELRLWQALNKGLIAPFHYFGIDDGIDLTGLKWSAGKYDAAELESRLVDLGRERFKIIWREVNEKVSDVSKMRAVAFCAGIRHARDTAARFRTLGVMAESLDSSLSEPDRDAIMNRFRLGEINMLCAVDLLNEGVDVPEIDTVLFLRPTESAVVFTQQLGRGLRLNEGKSVLTVLDFVGQQNKKFRFDLRYRAMTGLSRSELKRAIEGDFPSLPPGCHIKLDKISRDRALRNLREAVPTRHAELLTEVRNLLTTGEVTVGRFLEETGLEPEDFYRNKRSLFGLLEQVGVDIATDPRQDRLSAIAHIDDRDRTLKYREALESPHSGAYARMVAFPLAGTFDATQIPAHMVRETQQLLDYLVGTTSLKEQVADDLPFTLHARYTRDEIVVPFRDKPNTMRQGTFFVSSHNLDVHLLTLRKSERHFSKSTMYKDRVLSHWKVQWESQSTTSQSSPTGKRLTSGTSRNLLFVRENKDDPYHCLGLARPISYEGEFPILILWELTRPIPDAIYSRFVAAS